MPPQTGSFNPTGGHRAPTNQGDRPMIPCPECDHTDYHGKVEKEVHQRFGGTLEPVGEWVDCDYCDGSGEIEEEDDG